MPATMFHKPTGEWLTVFDRDSKRGDCHTLSISSKSRMHFDFYGEPRGCQFTTYTLAEPAAFSDRGEPMFNLDDCYPVCAIDHRAA